jgi:glutamine synthetase
MTPDEKTELKLDVGKIPEILLDNTDRNRTSPFAFTGNRFEFRAVGSSANCAAPMTALNTAVAQQLIQFKRDVDALIDTNVKKDEAIFQIIRKYIIDSKNVRFEGNNYSEEWKKEAKKRGLTNVNNVIEALDAYLTTKAKRLFKVQRVLNEKELEGRTDVRFDNYTKRIQIESRVIGDIALNQIVPSAIVYQTRLIDNVKGLKEVFAQQEYQKLAGARLNLIKTISEHITAIKAKVKDMTEARKVANEIIHPREKALQYTTTVLPYLEDIRLHIDKLEEILDNELWPLPKYRELLFTR